MFDLEWMPSLADHLHRMAETVRQLIRGSQRPVFLTLNAVAPTLERDGQCILRHVKKLRQPKR